MKDNRGSFSGKIGFVLAASGSAVGLGNLWRFPYLAAKYGGGCFLLVYLIFAITFGYALMITEVSIGRKTNQSSLTAFGKIDKRFGIAGLISALIPAFIMPYYSLIGGWIMRYLGVYFMGQTHAAADDSFFGAFISSTASPAILMLIFLSVCALIVSLGVEKGIESFSRLLMPLLVVLSIVIAVYSCTRPGALAGIKYYIIPDFSHFSVMTLVAAVGQLFFSMSLAMGIMITYGSYMPKTTDLEGAVTQIEIFDTVIAFLAGLMIIPAVFAFSGGDEGALNAGAGLMFVTMPKVFADMSFGTVIGAVFFILVLCAALTSAVSVFETVVSSICDKTGMSRPMACLVFWVFCVVLGLLCSFGYGILANVTPLGMQFLDFFDFLTNSLLMPICAILTCVLIGWVAGTKVVEDEVKLSSEFKRQRIFEIMIKWVAPIFLIAILITSVMSSFGLFSF